MERMLGGKQYNHGTRILQYLYNAFSRCKIEKFRIWLVENACGSLDSFTSRGAFEDFLNDVSYFQLSCELAGVILFHQG